MAVSLVFAGVGGCGTTSGGSPSDLEGGFQPDGASTSRGGIKGGSVDANPQRLVDAGYTDDGVPAERDATLGDGEVATIPDVDTDVAAD
jgi:hypothetical protein